MRKNEVKTRKATAEEMKVFEKTNATFDRDITENNITEDLANRKNQTNRYGEQVTTTNGLSWAKKIYRPAAEGIYIARLQKARVDEERDAIVLTYELEDALTKEKTSFTDWIRESRAGYVIGGVNDQLGTAIESIEELVEELSKNAIVLRLEPNPNNTQYLNSKYYNTILE